MSIDTIFNFFKVASILGPIIGVVSVLIAKSKKQIKIARVLLTIGMIPLGVVCGFIIFAIPSDLGWLGSSLRGEQGFIPALLSALAGAIILPIMVNKIIKRKLDTG